MGGRLLRHRADHLRRIGRLRERVMVIYKCWFAVRKNSFGTIMDKWLKDGWFLFGFIPLYVRDKQNREKF
jgi:hypothetical protein